MYVKSSHDSQFPHFVVQPYISNMKLLVVLGCVSLLFSFAIFKNAESTPLKCYACSYHRDNSTRPEDYYCINDTEKVDTGEKIVTCREGEWCNTHQIIITGTMNITSYYRGCGKDKTDFCTDGAAGHRDCVRACDTSLCNNKTTPIVDPGSTTTVTTTAGTSTTPSGASTFRLTAGATGIFTVTASLGLFVKWFM
ncbi:uncharacterized protein LOC106153367 [Lingula anatina]|uniref:Uncharacterized protein LOC106153367 n=1 Tax=Lingula anatina TaxID=7574 RepID=A0A1S3H9P3_LINAN|nr:uncharacterized protein LOC106153367 [Lingula anatina]|eukprot:XP_013382722.1 uncharacterized protein LOC106153367 [Lingula anatina]